MQGLLSAICFLTLLLRVHAAGGGRPGGSGGRPESNKHLDPHIGPLGGTKPAKPGSDSSTPARKQESLGHALEALGKIINELVDKTIIPSSASVTGNATGCLSAQSLYSSCSHAWTSAYDDNVHRIRRDVEDVISNLNQQAGKKGDYANAGITKQASCLCYSSANNVSTPLLVGTRFDGWISQRNEYLQTASIPATTTITTDTAPVIASAVLGQLPQRLSHLPRVVTAWWTLMFAVFVQCVLGECLTLSKGPWNFVGM
ncbi:MAG: hypothetical protein Q9164_006064 [Protoblastenia rupestris]